MKMFSECSGPCKTCKIHVSGAMCLAGHGDNDYNHANPEWIVANAEKGEQRRAARCEFIQKNYYDHYGIEIEKKH